MSLYAELKRRGVLKVGGAYVVVAWIVVQVASIAFPAFEAPAWVLRVFILIAMLGFPIALVMAWVLEVTPDGVRHEPSHLGNKRVFAISAGLVALALAWYFVGQPALRGGQAEQLAAATAKPAPAPAAPSVAAPSPKSIAVLPFVDFSQGRDQGWFADGLTEEILNALARTPDLQVSARTSSFAYKDSKLPIPQIATELGVAHVLEGSVRSTPTRIRVTAQLIRAADGFHVWSQTYDREAADVIAIQEDLARQIAIAMQTSMDPQALADMAQVGTRSVEAYHAYLRGLARQGTLESRDFTAAYELFEQARTLDPGFAAAHGRSAAYWFEQLDNSDTRSELSDLSAAEIGEHYSERIDLAIRHAPSPTDRLAYEAQKAIRELRLHEAIRLLDAYLPQRPGDFEAVSYRMRLASITSDLPRLAQMLDDLWPQAQARVEFAELQVNYGYRSGDRRKAADRALAVMARWPAHPVILYQVHRTLLWDERVPAAADVLARWQAAAGETTLGASIPLARQACAEGRRADAEALLALPGLSVSQRWHILNLLGRPVEATAALRELERDGNLFGTSGFLTYPNFDPTPFPALMQVLAREKVTRPPPIALPFACPPAKAAP